MPNVIVTKQYYPLIVTQNDDLEYSVVYEERDRTQQPICLCWSPEIACNIAESLFNTGQKTKL